VFQWSMQWLLTGVEEAPVIEVFLFFRPSARFGELNLKLTCKSTGLELELITYSVPADLDKPPAISEQVNKTQKEIRVHKRQTTLKLYRKYCLPCNFLIFI
jgi:hypothetical protein